MPTTKHYRKSIITSPLTGCPSGVSWISVGDGSGIAEVSNEKAQEFLDSKIRACRGGIDAITQEEFEAKKNSPSKRRFVTEVQVERPPLRAQDQLVPRADGSQVQSFSATADAKPSSAPKAGEPNVGTAPTGIISQIPGSLEEP